MGIFNKLFNRGGSENSEANTVSTSVVDNTPAPVVTPGFAPLNLNKGDILDLNKYSTSLTQVRASAGWKVNRGIGQDYDLDLCAYLMSGKDVYKTVYYGSRKGPGLYLDGDNLTGSDGQTDDENIFVTLNKIPSNVDRIVFAVVIYQADSRRQMFKNVQDAYMRLVDSMNNREICKYYLSTDGGTNTAATLASLNRTNEGWSFQAIGKYSKDSIGSLGYKL